MRITPVLCVCTLLMLPYTVSADPSPTTLLNSLSALPLTRTTLIKRITTKSLSPMELCGMKGCIMTATESDGRPLFAGPGCDHCADEWIPSPTAHEAPPNPAMSTDPTTTTVIAVKYTTFPTVVTQTTVVTSVSILIQTEVFSSTERAFAIGTSWTTRTTETTVTSTVVPSMAAYSGCTRIGTLDQGGALWSGLGCRGDSTFDGKDNTRCARVGTLDTNGALFVGEGCGKDGFDTLEHPG